MTYIPETLRQQVFLRAKRRCEYCQAQKAIIITLEIDHIMPVSLGGKTDSDNLCVACRPCNANKKDVIRAIDPQTNTLQRLFNPRTQIWYSNFQWDETGTIMIGLTPIGRATIEQLQMNDVDMVGARKIWVETGLHPPK
ncbi:MAG: HNH endonuclease [bacterium]|nr:HNH endonuclease [bacterium]